ncbi:GNAT family N-acetyltransferase [Mesorhizobium sp. CAU 1741]|uniref:GNAT family N-acetyltransferase n=1 Tax=Mesorhizobium sp. CAU 1741 TaxID=3140366 RepID=UPI00325A9B6C
MSARDYRPGVIGQIVRLHADYYAREWNFGLGFEAKVATELSAFLSGFRDGRDFFCCEFSIDGDVLGTVSLEAPVEGEPLGHLRWFILSDDARGTGLGRRLLMRALAHADAQGFAGTYLTTFAGLSAARHLYESCGFTLVAQADIDQWQGGVREQRFERMPSGTTD